MNAINEIQQDRLLSTPISKMTDADIAELKQRVYRDALVVLTDQGEVSPEVFVKWSHRMGTPQIYPIENYHHPDFAELYVSSNIRTEEGRYGVARTGYYWHTDCPFLSEPVPFTSLHMPQIPAGRRETWFINMVDVMRELPENLREKIVSTYAWHGHKGKYKIREQDVGKPMHELLDEINRSWPEQVHPVVAEHPVHGKEALYVSSGFTNRFHGLAVAESEATLQQLYDFTEQPHRYIRHVWEPGQVVIWDNRQLVHRNGDLPTKGDYVVFRISIFDGLPFFGNRFPKPTLVS